MSRRDIQLMKTFDFATWNLEGELVMESCNNENMLNDVLNDLTTTEMHNLINNVIDN